MRHAYALLGLSFLIVFGGAYLLIERAHAPTYSEIIEEPVVTDTIKNSMELTSPAFQNNKFIPSKYTCDGDNSNPPLRISNIPEGTKSLVLVIDDPDIPKEVKDARGIEKFDHLVLYNISPDIVEFNEGELTGSFGINGAGQETYTGPCPPPQYEPKQHRYIFRLYALSGVLNFIKAPTLDEVETAAMEMKLDSAELTGLYERVEQ